MPERGEIQAAIECEMPEAITFIVQRTPDGHYLAQADGFPIAAEGSTVEVLKATIAAEVEEHFDETQRPRSIRLHYHEEEEAGS